MDTSRALLGLLLLVASGCSAANDSAQAGAQAASTHGALASMYAGVYTRGDDALLISDVGTAKVTFSTTFQGNQATPEVTIWASGVDAAWRFSPGDGAATCAFTFEPSEDALSVEVAREGDCTAVRTDLTAGTYQRVLGFAAASYETPRLLAGFSAIDIESSSTGSVTLSIATVDAGGRTGGADHVQGMVTDENHATVVLDQNEPSHCSLDLVMDPKLGLAVTQRGSCEGIVGEGQTFAGAYDIAQESVLRTR